MEQTLTFLFCEGKHEPPFIQRMLRTASWKNLTEKPSNKYPNSLQRYLLGQLNQLEAIATNGNWRSKIGLLPWYVLRRVQVEKKKEDFIVIWNTGGTKNYTILNEVVKSFKAIQEINGFDEMTTAPINIVLFYDNSKPFAERITTFKKNLEAILPQSCEALSLENDGQIIENTDTFHKIGLFTFANSEKNKTLEEYFTPLMKIENEPIFDAANEFLKLSAVTWQQSDWNKERALISITGQLQKAGYSNDIFVSESTYLSNDKIKNDKNAQQLVAFIQEIID
jgi:hypothetical protein